MNLRLQPAPAGTAPCSAARHAASISGRALLFGVLLQFAVEAGAVSNGSLRFVVLGDNRGDPTGEISPVFREVLEAVRQTRPELVLHTGDMIYGHTNLAAARLQWQAYKDTVNALGVPVHHVPGNHDIWDTQSGSLYRETLGPAYWSFTNGSTLFLGLDTESHRSRLGAEQWAWLRQNLAQAGPLSVFVILHRPLFPAGAGMGTSLDVYPSERDKLHRLLVEYRRSIKAVFAGHEHLYHFHQRDGVAYYITGGAGANLYAAPELGGFHHFLLVQATKGAVKTEVKRVGAGPSALQKAVEVRPGSLLESWEDGLVWYPWDYTVTAELSDDQATEGSRGLQLSFDSAQCRWPVLSLPLYGVTGWEDAAALLIDVYLPHRAGPGWTLTPAFTGTAKFAAPTVQFRGGWNTVRLPPGESWLPAQERGTLRSVEWAVNSPLRRGTMSVVFDNFRTVTTAAPDNPQVLESWERALLWRVLNESVKVKPDEDFASDGRRGLRLVFDFSTCREPIALARLNPPWDLRKAAKLALDVFVSEESPKELTASIGLRASEVSHVSPAVPLRRGWNRVRAAFDADWLPEAARAAAEQIECRFSARASPSPRWLVLDNLRAE